MGGLVATHLAVNKNLDFLLADRNFSRLSDIIFERFGNTVSVLFKLFRGDWDVDCS
jgi:hypothetical protein